MSEFYAFAGQHPFLTFVLAYLATCPIRYGFRAYNRHCRTKNIAAHGWPTNPLMDADGDIVHKEAS